MVPKAGLEPARLAPLPPQACSAAVVVNFEEFRGYGGNFKIIVISAIFERFETEGNTSELQLWYKILIAVC
jgi:hypothetical protein